MPKERILITGGAGFIGCALVHDLLQESQEVYVLDNLHVQVHGNRGWPEQLSRDVITLPGNVVDSPSWSAVVRAFRPAIVIHLAAETGTGQSLTEASRHAEVNVLGTTRMIDAFSQTGHRPSQILLTSSRAIYGEGRWISSSGASFYPGLRTIRQLEAGQWNPESPDGLPAHPMPHDCRHTEPRPTNVYGATKLAQEHILDAWCSAMSVPLTILRLQNVYGPGQSPNNHYTGVLTHFARKALLGEQLEVYEGGAILRDFVHVSDVIAAILSSLVEPLPGRRTLDIGSGLPITLFEAAQRISVLAGSPAPRITNSFRPGDVRAAYADIREAKEMIGYEPKVQFEEGIKTVLKWIRGQL